MRPAINQERCRCAGDVAVTAAVISVHQLVCLRVELKRREVYISEWRGRGQD